jgi:hypothetical protein
MRLPFLPREEGYSATPVTSTIDVTELVGGQASRRRVLDDRMIRFTVQFSLNKNQYEFFDNFYYQWLRDKANTGRLKYFDILLIYQPTNPEYPLHNFKCVFVEDTLTISEASGLDISVNVDLEGYLDDVWPMSAVYPISADEVLQVLAFGALNGETSFRPPEDLNVGVFSVIEGEVVYVSQGFHEYSIPYESLSVSSFAVIEGLITTTVYNKYENYEPEELKVGEFAVIEAVFKHQLVAYKNYSPENLSVGQFSIIEGIIGP